MVDVFLTIDTEISFPLTSNWKETELAFEIERDIHGRTAHGDYGIGYQMDLLREHGLKGVFFVEGLVASAAGRKPLEAIIGMILRGGHEIQLHLHTQWLRLMEASPVEGRDGRWIRHFDREDQARLVAAAAANLTACGAPPVRAFRAGSFGANPDTLHALRDVGISFDSSLNPAAFHWQCDLRMLGPVTQPMEVEGVLEFPVTVFEAVGGRHKLRPFQICACSVSEMKETLELAWRHRWRAVTIVSHGFELVKRPERPDALGRRSHIRARRFRELCRYLDGNRDRFRTRGFADWTGGGLETEARGRLLRMPPQKSAWRVLEQAADRFF